MADWELDEITDTVAQLVSELVTNSVEHANTARVRLIVMRVAAALRVDVADQDAVSLPERMRAAPDDIRGRGLAIVEAMSDRWGVSVTDTGKSVWCELAVPHADSWPS